MNLADHLRPLLRDHDCVIIPDFGGLVAEYTPAQVRPAGRHLLFPPTRQVAFNQALTRNDGLLVDALRQHLGLAAPEAREAVRQAVALLHQQLQAEQRTELPGIGVFRQLPGRGLQFDYTGTDNLLPTAYGLPELTAHPVRVLDARLAREQQAQLVPRLRSAGSQVRWRRLVPGAAIGLLAGIAVATLYLLGLHPEAAPVAVRPYLPHFDAVAAARPAPQQAALAQPSFALPAASHPAAAPDSAALPVASLAGSAAQPAGNSAMPASRPAAPASRPAVGGWPAVGSSPASSLALTAPQPAEAPLPVAAPASAAVPTSVAALPLRQPAVPAQTVPAPAAHVSAAPNAAEVLLMTPSRPARKLKMPKGAAIALASDDNVAHPVPLAKRQPGTKGMSMVYPVAPPTAKWTPTVNVMHPGLVAGSFRSVPAAATKPAAPAAVAVPKAGAKLPPAVAKAPAAVAKAPAAGAAATINKRTGRYYVVVAAYNSLRNAEQGRQVLARTGRPAKIILPYFGTRHYRLSVADFPDKASAEVAAAKLRQNPNFDKGLSVLPY